MTPILKFTPVGLGREVVTLGAVRVGEVMRLFGRRTGEAASYTVCLPDVPTAFRPADSMFKARSAVVRAVDDWLARVGIFCPGDGVDVRVPESHQQEARRA